MFKKRYKAPFFIYFIFLILWLFLEGVNLNISNDEYGSLPVKDGKISDYWFLMYYNDRYWFVDKSGKVCDVYQEYANSELKTSPFVSGIKVNNETGELDKKLLSFIPKDIPNVIFEINLSEKYITTTKSSIICFTDIDDIVACSSVLRTVGEYLDPGKIFLFKNGKLYLL